MAQTKTRLLSMTFIALLTALSLVFKAFLTIPITPSLRLSFGLLPIILWGFLVGPWAGFASGALADILAFFLGMSGSGPYFPGFSLTYALSGMLPVLLAGSYSIFTAPDASRRAALTLRTTGAKFYLRLFIAVALSQLCTSVLLNAFFTGLIGYGTFWTNLPTRLVTQAVMAPLFSAFSMMGIKAYQAVFKSTELRWEVVLRRAPKA